MAEVMCSTYIVLARLGGKYSFRIEEGGEGIRILEWEVDVSIERGQAGVRAHHITDLSLGVLGHQSLPNMDKIDVG